MAKLRVFHYGQCSTCKKALKWLADHASSNELELIDIVQQPPTRAELALVLKRAGIPVRKLFNTAGASYREGGFGERLASMTDAQAIEALARDGKLIKRPLLIGKDLALVGFAEEAYARAFES